MLEAVAPDNMVIELVIKSAQKLSYNENFEILMLPYVTQHHGILGVHNPCLRASRG